MLFFLVLFLSASVYGIGPMKQPYHQIFPDRYTFKNAPRLADWDQLPFSDVQSIASLNDTFLFVLSTSGLFFYQENRFVEMTSRFSNIPLGKGAFVLPLDDATIVVITNNTYSFCPTDGTCSTKSFNFQTINGVALDSKNQRVFVASNSGLYTVEPSKVTTVLLTGAPFISVAVREDGTVAAGTQLKLYRTIVPGDFSSFHYFLTPGIIDAAPLAIAFDRDGKLWIANQVCINVQYPDLTFKRYGGNDGLPTNNLTSISVDVQTNDIWVGSQQGLVRFEQSNNKWHYYYGPRYLPGKAALPDGQNVSFVQAFSSPTVRNLKAAIVPDGGIAIF